MINDIIICTELKQCIFPFMILRLDMTALIQKIKARLDMFFLYIRYNSQLIRNISVASHLTRYKFNNRVISFCQQSF